MSLSGRIALWVILYRYDNVKATDALKGLIKQMFLGLNARFGPLLKLSCLNYSPSRFVWRHICFLSGPRDCARSVSCCHERDAYGISWCRIQVAIRQFSSCSAPVQLLFLSVMGINQ